MLAITPVALPLPWQNGDCPTNHICSCKPTSCRYGTPTDAILTHLNWNHLSFMCPRSFSHRRTLPLAPLGAAIRSCDQRAYFGRKPGNILRSKNERFWRRLRQIFEKAEADMWYRLPVLAYYLRTPAYIREWRWTRPSFDKPPCKIY